MKYIKATIVDRDIVYDLVQETIKTIYPKYYPREVVEFFCNHHCKENVEKDIKDGHAWMHHFQLVVSMSIEDMKQFIMTNGSVRMELFWFMK